MAVASRSLDSVRLNNALQQLRDNDLYLEAAIRNSGKFRAGPGGNVKEEVDAAPDGHKVWDDQGVDDKLTVLRKEAVPPGETL